MTCFRALPWQSPQASIAVPSEYEHRVFSDHQRNRQISLAVMDVYRPRTLLMEILNYHLHIFNMNVTRLLNWEHP